MWVDTNASSSLLLYPFLFAAERFEERVAQVQEAKAPGQERDLSLWSVQKFPEDDLLAHVRRYLNPPEGTRPTALLWQMEHNAMRNWLTEQIGGRVSRQQLSVNRRRIPFELISIQLALFRVGVGFLIIQAQPISDSPEDWLDFLHAFRFAYGQRGVRLQIELSATPGEPSPPEPRIQTLGQLIDNLLQTCGLPTERAAREVFVPGQLLPFAVLYVDAPRISSKRAAELLYRVRNFFHTGRIIRPSASDLSMDHPALLPYADQMWFTFSLEGGAFVAFNAPRTDFFRNELPIVRLRKHYFLLYLLALHQRFALLSLSQQVAEHWLTGNARQRTRAFERIRDRLLDFTARGYFTQVMQRENHHRVYKKWQETFQLEQIYREVSDEVREMHEYILMEQTRRLERRVNLLGAFVGAPALVMTFLGINLRGITAQGEGLPFWLALVLSLGAGGLLGAVVLWLLNRR